MSPSSLGTDRAIDVRMRLAVPPGGHLGLGQLADQIRGVQAMLYLVHLSPPAGNTEAINARVASKGARVVYLSYNSPLELAVTLGAGLTSAAVVANRLMKAYDNFQTLRASRARADLRVAALEVLTQHVHGLRGASADQLANDQMFAASMALAQIESLEIQS